MTQKRSIALILIVLSALAILFVGLQTEVFLGDEVHHFSFAKDSYELGRRAVYDINYGPKMPPGYYFATEPLWPLGLAVFWKLTGGISQSSAQIYHLGFYLLLLFSVFGLARKLYGIETAIASTVLIATMPMMITFGILFYVDVPAAALSALLFLFLVNRRYFWSGVILGLLYLMKRSGLFFVPAIFFIVFFSRGMSLWQKGVKGFILFAASLTVVAPDIMWRALNFRKVMTVSSSAAASNAAASNEFEIKIFFFDIFINIRERITHFLSWKFWEVQEYLNSSLLAPRDVAVYFGLAFVIAFSMYFLSKKAQKKDLFLWVPIGVYMVFYAVLLRLGSDIRYVMPIVPLLVILAARGIVSLKAGAWRNIIYGLCLVQVLSVSGLIYHVRKRPESLKKAFTYVRDEVPEDSLLIYIESNLSEYTGRKIMWGLGGVTRMFWLDEPGMSQIIRNNEIDYIAIKKARIYDDDEGRIRHHGGYPKSFVDRMPGIKFLEQVYDNEAMSIWQIKRTKLP